MGEEVRTNTLPRLAADGANWVTYHNHMMLAFRRQGLGDHLTHISPTPKAKKLAAASNVDVNNKWEDDELAFQELIAISIPNDDFH
jgi:hypothetical protein